MSQILEKHTVGIIQKLEGHIPLHFKSVSDFSREYMKLLGQGFKINCSIEGKMFGNMGIDEKSIKLLDEYLETSSKFYTAQIDMTTELFKNYLSMRLSLMESYNKFVQDVADKIILDEQIKK